MENNFIRNLEKLRSDTLSKAIMISNLKKILLKYYPIGTKLIITKDYYKIEVPEENENN